MDSLALRRCGSADVFGIVESGRRAAVRGCLMPKEGTATDFGGRSVSRLKVGNAETPTAIGFFLLNRLNRLRESQERKAEAGAGLRRLFGQGITAETSAALAKKNGG